MVEQEPEVELPDPDDASDRVIREPSSHLDEEEDKTKEPPEVDKAGSERPDIPVEDIPSDGKDKRTERYVQETRDAMSQTETESVPDDQSATLKVSYLQWERHPSTSINVLYLMLQKIQDTMADLLTRFEGLNELAHAIHDFQQGNATVQDLANVTYRDPRERRVKLPRYSTASGVSASSDEPAPGYHFSEAALMRFFPIPVYTEAINWLLKRPIVKKFFYFHICKLVYTCAPSTKADWETVMSTFMDYVVTKRLQCHMGKAKATGSSASKLQFGRFPLPQPLLKIADECLVTLHKVKVEGERDNADFFNHHCGSSKKTHLLASKYVTNSNSVQEMAQKLIWERFDFFLDHRVTLSTVLMVGCWHLLLH